MQCEQHRAALAERCCGMRPGQIQANILRLEKTWHRLRCKTIQAYHMSQMMRELKRTCNDLSEQELVEIHARLDAAERSAAAATSDQERASCHAQFSEAAQSLFAGRHI